MTYYAVILTHLQIALLQTIVVVVVKMQHSCREANALAFSSCETPSLKSDHLFYVNLRYTG